MVIRTVNGREKDVNGNVEVGTVRTINGISPTDEGDIIVPTSLVTNDNRGIVIWFGTTTTSSEGNWTIDYSSVGFTEIKTIHITLESNTTTIADKPLGGHVMEKDNTTASGKAYKVSSAGLLAAMQQIAVDSGVIVHVAVTGYKEK